MKINSLKLVTVVGAVSLVMGLGSIAQAAVYIQPVPRCNYYAGYMVCYGPGGSYHKYYAYRSVKVCGAHGICQIKYCYKTPYGPPSCYYPNRVY